MAGSPGDGVTAGGPAGLAGAVVRFTGMGLIWHDVPVAGHVAPRLTEITMARFNETFTAPVWAL